MTRIYSILTFLFLCFLSFGQLKFSTTKYDFGDLEPYSARYVDIALENIGQKEEWILRVQKTMEVTYITSKQIIPVDSTTIIRLHVNPRKKGRFSYDVEIYTSDQDEATKVKLVGSISDLPQDGGNMFTACPSFGDRPGGKDPNGFDLTVVTIDKETREPLSKSKVTMLQGGQPIARRGHDHRPGDGSGNRRRFPGLRNLRRRCAEAHRQQCVPPGHQSGQQQRLFCHGLL